jgi:uroporphyrinogen-III decarboxylase
VSNLAQLDFDELMGFSPNIDIKEFRKALPDTILGGNIHPIKVMLEGTPNDVKAAARYCFENANQNQKFVLCTGGSISGPTKPENIDAFIESTWEIVKY